MKLILSRSFASFVVQFVVLISLTFTSSAGCAPHPEKQGSGKTIRVVMDDNYPPYVFKDDQGKLKGIIVDQWRLWEKKTGIAILLTGMDWSEAQRRMQAGEFDVIDTIFRNEKREAIYDFSKPYAQLEVPLFFHDDISGIRGPEDLTGFLVAAKAGDNSIDILKKHGVTTIVEYPSYEKLLEAVRNGKARVFTVDRPPALYFLNKFGIQNRFHETKPLYHGEFHRAVLKGQTALLSAVESGFAAISKKDFEEIDRRWMGSDITSSHTHYVRNTLYGAGLITSIILLLVFWLRTLRRAVAEKTAELIKSKELFSLFMCHSPIYLYIKEVTPDGVRVLQASENFQDMVGIPGSKMIGKMMTELFPAEFAAKTDADDRAVVAGGVVLKIEEEFNGRSYATIKFPLKQDEKALLAGFTIDITERKQAEEALRQSEATFRKLFEASSDAILLIDESGVFVECNQAALDLLKMTREQFIFLPPVRISPEFQPDGRRSEEAALDMIAQAYQKGLHRFDWTCINAEGGEFIVEVSLMPVTIKGQIMLHTTWRDITERKRTEQVLQLSEQKFATIFNLMPDMIGITRMADGVFIEVNAGFERWTGWPREEVIGKSTLDLELWTPEARADAIAIIQKQGRLEEFEFIMRKKSGELRTAQMYLLPIVVQDQQCLFFLARDVTELKQAVEERINFEKQLLHAQKLESLGVLAGGIAHDFNNILVAIMGNADLALMRINKESPATENLHRIEQAAARAADLAKQMLAYSGKGKFMVENIDLNNLLEDMLHMLEVSISKKAVLRLNLHTPLPSVEADATQLRQIIMNLVINASEAIGDKSGIIAITTGCMDCDKNYLKDVWLDENITAGLYVYLEIADSGCGMDKETLAKLFDPFFTTKFTGRGLGMAAVLGIVRGHKGAIKVYSEPNRGTTFKILLPASNRPAELFNGHTHGDEWHGSGTALLVDDEETVRGIGREMLEELGFTVITAGDGREGVAAFKENPDIAFAILDLTMPHMDGEQCFRELRQLKPDVKVLMSSGYSEQEVSEKFIGKGLAGFIQKPYNLSTLRDAVRAIS